MEGQGPFESPGWGQSIPRGENRTGRGTGHGQEVGRIVDGRLHLQNGTDLEGALVQCFDPSQTDMTLTR